MPYLHTVRIIRSRVAYKVIFTKAYGRQGVRSILIYSMCVGGVFKMICELHQNNSQLQCCSSIDLFVCVCAHYCFVCWQHNNRLEFIIFGANEKRGQLGGMKLANVCIGSSWQIGTAVTVQLNNLLEQKHTFYRF